MDKTKKRRGPPPMPIADGAANVIKENSYEEAAHILGVHYHTVRKWATALGVKAVGVEKRHEMKKKGGRLLAQMVVESQSTGIVAKQLSVSRQTIHQRIRPFAKRIWVLR